MTLPAVPADALVAVRPLRDALHRVWQRGLDHISYDALHAACYAAIESARDSGRDASTSSARSIPELASVLAASVVYRYVKANRPWRMNRDKSDRLYALPDVLETLDDLQA